MPAASQLPAAPPSGPCAHPVSRDACATSAAVPSVRVQRTYMTGRTATQVKLVAAAIAGPKLCTRYDGHQRNYLRHSSHSSRRAVNLCAPMCAPYIVRPYGTPYQGVGENAFGGTLLMYSQATQNPTTPEHTPPSVSTATQLANS